MSKELNVAGVHILNAYLDYTRGMFVVNRKYQRKLVWEIEEKQSFINTVFHDYPVPIFILADYQREDKEWHEVIDGLQRLDAIFSFIEGKFSITWKDKEGYFNLDAIPSYGSEVRSGKREQKEPVLNLEDCGAFLTYSLPVSTTHVSDTEVEDIFRRINSTGRKLSKQDLRQAGAIGHFSDLVRKTATYLRGDYTNEDHVGLAEMPAISYSNFHLQYGISVRQSFWAKQGVLTEKNIRNSADEELIAKLYGYIILGDIAAPTSYALDTFYREGSSRNLELTEKIEKYGIGKLTHIFTEIIEMIKSLFHDVNSDYSSWLFHDNRKSGKGKVFQAFFLALYDLKQEGYVMVDNTAIAKAIKGMGDGKFREITDDGDWNTNVRNEAIQTFKMKLKPHMLLKRDSKGAEEDRRKVEYILNKAAGTEHQMFDAKVGISLFPSGKLNTKCLDKIIKTLVAMANTKPEEVGYVILGIADNKEAADSHKRNYKVNYNCYGNFFITGIDAEVKQYRGGLDNYMQTVKRAIEHAPLQRAFQDYILKNYSVVQYGEKTLMILSCKATETPMTYDKNYYVRYGSNLKYLEPGSPEFDELMKSFYG